MADDSRETDSTSIDSAINELAERKNGKHNSVCIRPLDSEDFFALNLLVIANTENEIFTDFR